jgi:beta-glucanase (GH16 family)
MIFTTPTTRRRAFLVFSLTALLLLFSLPTPLSALRDPATTIDAYPFPPAINASWKLTFDDEFSGTGVDWERWKDGGKNWGSGGNGEEQTYLPEQCSVEHGLLQIQADSTPAQGKQYSSCMLNTMQTFQQTYGYFAFRGRLPRGQGFWPAFWLYESATDGAPEIDVMENLGNDTTTYYMTYHADTGAQQQIYHGVDLASAFHTYAVK